jgi:hypothetical protein
MYENDGERGRYENDTRQWVTAREFQRCPKRQCKKKRSFRPTVLLHCIESPEAAPLVINLDVEED